jgi:hypothetical protein
MNEQNNIDQGPVDQRIQDLLNSSIDGEISKADQDELDRLLVTSDSVRNLNEELRAVTHILDELPEVEPPQYLQESIKRQVRVPVQISYNTGRPGLLGRWLNTNWLRAGFALAAGVVLTVSVYEMGSEPITGGDSTRMVGTMAKRDLTAQPGILLDSIHLDTDKLNGLVELRNIGDLFTLDVQLNSEGPSELVVNLAGRGLEFDGVSRMQNPVDAVSVVDGAIHLASSGEQRYTVSLRRISKALEDETLELDFFANNELIQQAKLNVSKF